MVSPIYDQVHTQRTLRLKHFLSCALLQTQALVVDLECLEGGLRFRQITVIACVIELCQGRGRGSTLALVM